MKLLILSIAVLLTSCIHTPPPPDDSEVLIWHLLRVTADPFEGMDRISQHALDMQAFVELHNHRHPEDPMADVETLLRDMCGDCKRERAIRAAQLREEATK